MDKLAIEGGQPVRKEVLAFGSPRIENEEIEEVVDSLRAGWLSTGPKVHKFKELFREYIGCKHALALNSCTAGLHLSLIVSGIKEGDEVITTPLTFSATANTILHVGAKPVFVDVEKDTMNINPDLIKSKITEKTKAIIPVHMAGRPCDMDKIMTIAKKHKLIVIEDAAHAIEAWYKGKKIGNISPLTCFSFYATKNIITGEGGMVTTNNNELAEKIQMYSYHGMNKGVWSRYFDNSFKHYQVIYPGYKYNMMDLQAAIGLHQLPRVDDYLKIREAIWHKYNEAFKELPVIIPKPPEEDTIHARHLYILLLDIKKIDATRNEIKEALYKEGIGTGIHFISLHLHPYYRKSFGFKEEDFPNARFISKRTISLPLSAKLSEKDVDDVITAVRKVILNYAK